MTSIPVLHRLAMRYQELESRDRIALIVLGGFFLVLFVYFGLWSPVHRFHEDSEAERNRQLGLIQYMESTLDQARASKAKTGGARSGQSLLTEVSRSAQQVGIKPGRLQPEGSNSVSIWFEKVAFNDLIRMLERMRDRQGITVQQISIDREDEPGLVRSRIVLRAS